MWKSSKDPFGARMMDGLLMATDKDKDKEKDKEKEKEKDKEKDKDKDEELMATDSLSAAGQRKPAN
eukprot:SAG31_NODE_1426_length_8393_cov_3.363275_5_plen_66_part_00